MRLTKIHTLDMMIIVAIIEGLALVFRRLFFDLGVNAIVSGFLIGFLTMLPLFFIFNKLKFNLRIWLDEKKYLIKSSSILLPCFYSGLFLMLVFLFNTLLIGINGYIRYFVMAFIPALFVILLINFLKFKIKINDKKLSKISFAAAIYVGIFEFFLVPMMDFKVTSYIYLNELFVGLIAGAVGAMVSMLFVNYFLETFPMKFELK